MQVTDVAAAVALPNVHDAPASTPEAGATAQWSNDAVPKTDAEIAAGEPSTTASPPAPPPYGPSAMTAWTMTRMHSLTASLPPESEPVAVAHTSCEPSVRPVRVADHVTLDGPAAGRAGLTVTGAPLGASSTLTEIPSSAAPTTFGSTSGSAVGSVTRVQVPPETSATIWRVPKCSRSTGAQDARSPTAKA